MVPVQSFWRMKMSKRKKIEIFISAAIVAVLSSIPCFAQQNTIQHNIDTLIRTNACAGCNLSGADLNRMNLAGADLSDADLSDASFFLADLSDANLSGANLRGAKFGGADLANTDFRDADLRGAMLEGAYLVGAVIDGTVLENDRTEAEGEAEISPKVFVPDQSKPKEVMDHKKVAFEADQEKEEINKEAQKVQAAPPVKTVTPVQQPSLGTEEEQPVEPAVKTAAAVPVAEEKKASVGNVEKKQESQPVQETEIKVDKTADVTQSAAPVPAMIPVASAEIIEKMLDRRRCYGCDLSGVNLSGKNLSGADLEGSNLSGAILNDVDLAGANLKGVSLRGAQLRNADLRKVDLYKADLSNADLTDADFRGAKLDEANFSGAQGYNPPLMTQ